MLSLPASRTVPTWWGARSHQCRGPTARGGGPTVGPCRGSSRTSPCTASASKGGYCPAGKQGRPPQLPYGPMPRRLEREKSRLLAGCSPRIAGGPRLGRCRRCGGLRRRRGRGAQGNETAVVEPGRRTRVGPWSGLRTGSPCRGAGPGLRRGRGGRSPNPQALERSLHATVSAAGRLGVSRFQPGTPRRRRRGRGRCRANLGRSRARPGRGAVRLGWSRPGQER